MNKEDLLQDIIDTIQPENEITFNTELETIDEWDSLSKNSISALLNSKYKIKIAFSELSNFKKVEDICQFIEDNHEK